MKTKRLRYLNDLALKTAKGGMHGDKWLLNEILNEFIPLEEIEIEEMNLKVQFEIDGLSSLITVSICEDEGVNERFLEVDVLTTQVDLWLREQEIMSADLRFTESFYPI